MLNSDDHLVQVASSYTYSTLYTNTLYMNILQVQWIWFYLFQTLNSRKSIVLLYDHSSVYYIWYTKIGFSLFIVLYLYVSGVIHVMFSIKVHISFVYIPYFGSFEGIRCRPSTLFFKILHCEPISI